MSDEIDDKTEEANKAALEKFKQLTEGKEEPVVLASDDENVTEVEIGADDEEDERLSRKEKKAARFREMADAKRRAEEQVETLRKQLELQQQQSIQAAQLLQMQQQLSSVQNPNGKKDPVDDEIDRIYAARQRLQETYQAKLSQKTLTQDEERQLQREARELEERLIDARVEKRTRTLKNPDPQESVAQNIRARHVDVYQNEAAIKYAQGLYQMRRARGVQDSMDLVDDCMDEARKEFKMGRFRHGVEPANGQKERYAAPPSGANGQQPTLEGARVRMTPEFKRMANSLFAHIPDESKRMQLWANGPGKSMLEASLKKA
jgi:hypothetical protein